jgi:hypothetical protein
LKTIPNPGNKIINLVILPRLTKIKKTTSADGSALNLLCFENWSCKYQRLLKWKTVTNDLGE